MRKGLKILGVLAVVVVGIAVFAGIALAQGPDDGSVPPTGPVDQDGDGICDICGQEIGDGLMRGWRFNQDGDATQLRQGPPADRPFVDADGDGVCDNYPTGLQAGRMGGRR
jgi:hypothetical protein